jgi:hypothetical protein
MSERGSLHSMRSHFNPSVRSTGSAPASRRDGSGSVGSSPSRPSAHSIARTGSISSDGRRRPNPTSPTPSAFGYSRSPLSNNNKNKDNNSRSPFDDPPLPSILPTIGSPPCAHVTPDKKSTVRSLGGSIGSGSVGTVMDMDGLFGTVRGADLTRSGSTSQFSATSPLNAPWAAGLDNDWMPARM